MNRRASSSVWGSRVNTHLLVHHPSPSLVTHLHGRLAILGRNNQSQFVGKVLGQHHVLHLETSTRDKAGPPPVQPLIPSVTCLPIHPFRTPNQRGHGGVSPLLLGPSQRGFAPLIHTLYKERSRRLCTLRFDHAAGGARHSLLRRLPLGSVPVVLRSVPPPWHPELSKKNISSTRWTICGNDETSWPRS